MTQIIEKIRDLRANDNEITAAEISDILGISRQRVWQILKQEGMPTRTRRSSALRGNFAAQRTASAGLSTGGVSVPITATASGMVCELLVSADLTARGYTVYAPICRHNAHADLIAIKRDSQFKPILIEVRSGKRTPSGGITYNKKPESLCDCLAVVITGERDILYTPKI